MPAPVFISICIPAYKNTAYLKRALDAILIQTFLDYEVVITDDSPDDSIKEVCFQYQHSLPIRYFRNPTALGTPENWNAGMRLAKGQWIKMMHDDDWFTDQYSLQRFAQVAQQTNASFLYSGYIKVEEKTGQQQTLLPRKSDITRFKKHPDYIITFNLIGHPSTTMVRNEAIELYDEALKWMVDVEYYYRFLRKGTFLAISAPLVCIGMNDEQVTKAVFRQPMVEIPENLYVLNKLGLHILSSLTVYDHFWRMIRNLQIRNNSQIDQYHKNNTVPAVIYSMVRHQRWLPTSLLKIGAISKVLMLLSWLWTGITGLRKR